MSETIEVPRPFVGLYLGVGNDFTVLEIHGPATRASMLSLFSQVAAAPTARLLWDLRDCPLGHLGIEDLHWMERQLIHVHRLSLRLGTGRSAFVCSGEADAVVLHRLIAFTEANDNGIRLALFRDFDVARRWLADA